MISGAHSAPTPARNVVTATPLASAFLAAFRSLLTSDRNLAENLKGAADGRVLRPWTELLTSAVARSCMHVGWDVAAKGVTRSPLPFPRYECLGLDVVAFTQGTGWRPVIAAFELENAKAFNTVAYALWKAASVQSNVAGLFCFRKEPNEIGSLVTRLADEVMRPLPKPPGELLLVVGTRSSAQIFPDGYFRVFTYDAASNRFRAGTLDGGPR